MLKFEVLGVSQLIGEMAAATVAAPIVAEVILNKVAENVKNTAKDTVPVLTGALQDSIAVDKPQKLQRDIGSHLRYAGFVEFGGMHAPQPYLGPALDKHEDELEHGLADLGEF